MPKCLSLHHGEIEYAEDTVMRFAGGLPGFEEETAFLPIEIPSARPIVFLQSLSTPDLCFVTLPVFVVDQDYKLALPAESRAAIGLAHNSQPRIGEDVLCLVLVTIQDDGPTTTNLMAPVVMDLRTRRAVQAIREDGVYSHRHVFLEAPVGVECS
jgi:flagellar assembly factor FliW